MLDKDFDQIFRDRLLDHPSMVRQGLWRQVHTQLVRYHAVWRWYFVGPSAVAAVVATYFLVTGILSSSPAKHASPAAAVATYKHHPNPDSSAAATAAGPSSAPNSSAATVSSAPASSSTASSATASSAAPASPSHPTAPGALATASPTTSPAPPASSTRALAVTRSSHTTPRLPRHSDNHPDRHPGATTGSDDAALAAAAGSTTGKSAIATTNATTTTANANAAPSPHPPIPAQLTAQAKLATLKTHPDIAALTANPKKPQQLTLPARRRHKVMPPVRLEVFGAPEYFTAHIFGLSYGAGARATVVFKKHWTFTTGLQYLRVAVRGTIDSATFLPGDIKNLNLPLLVGYTTGNDRFTFSAKGGVLINLYAHSEGQMSYTGLWTERDGTSAYLGLDFASHVTGKVSVFAEPYLKRWYYQPHQSLPFYPSSLPFRAWSTGVMLGARYSL